MSGGCSSGLTLRFREDAGDGGGAIKLGLPLKLTPLKPNTLSAFSSINPSAPDCRTTSSAVIGGGDAAARPSGVLAMHSAASSAVPKRPRCTRLPPRCTFAW